MNWSRWPGNATFLLGRLSQLTSSGRTSVGPLGFWKGHEVGLLVDQALARKAERSRLVSEAAETMLTLAGSSADGIDRERLISDAAKKAEASPSILYLAFHALVSKGALKRVDGGRFVASTSARNL